MNYEHRKVFNRSTGRIFSWYFQGGRHCEEYRRNYRTADGVDWITDKAEAGCDIVADWAMAKVIDMANEAMQFEKFKQQCEAIDKNKTGDAKPQEESELRKKFEARKKAMKEAEAKTMPTEVEEDLIDDIEIITAI